MSSPSHPTDSKPLQVRRGRVASVDLFEAKENELDLLEKGSPASIQLNFAVFLLTMAFSSILALCTATFRSQIAENLCIVVSVVGNLMGVYLLISWWRTRTPIAEVVRAIRQRIDVQEAEDSAAAAPPRSETPRAKDNQPVG